MQEEFFCKKLQKYQSRDLKYSTLLRRFTGYKCPYGSYYKCQILTECEVWKFIKSAQSLTDNRKGKYFNSGGEEAAALEPAV